MVPSDIQTLDEGGVAEGKIGKELGLESTLNLHKYIHQNAQKNEGLFINITHFI